MGTLVDYRTDRGVALITLNDPPVNACTHEMLNELDGCITDARFDEDVHVIVITGHGEHSFCAGANLHMLHEVDQGFWYNFFLYMSEMLCRLERTPKLVLAAINGHAVGSGLEIALACDLRIVRAGDVQLALPQLELGMMPGSGGIQRLAQLLGKGAAMQLLLEAQRLSPEQALEAGLVNYVWNAENQAHFLEQVLDYARRFTPPQLSPLAVGRLKLALQGATRTYAEPAASLERELHAQLCRSQDAAEGVGAWLEKRKAKFTGR